MLFLWLPLPFALPFGFVKMLVFGVVDYHVDKENNPCEGLRGESRLDLTIAVKFGFT